MKIKKSSNIKKIRRKKSKRNKGKQPVNFPTRSTIRPINKFRLNQKALFDPSLKTKKPIVIKDGIVKVSLGDTDSEIKTKRNLNYFDPGGYRWLPTFSNWLKTIFWQFW